MTSPVNRLAQRARESRGDHSSVFSIMQYDWPKRKQKYFTSQKSFCSSVSQTLLFGGEKRRPEIRLRSQATIKRNGSEVTPHFQECSP